jgi:hypothetical protein
MVERQAREDADRAAGQGAGGERLPEAPGVGLGAALTAVRARGLDPAGDADAAQLAGLERLRQDLELPAALPATKLLQLVAACGGRVPTEARPAPAAGGALLRTMREREGVLRGLCQRLAAHCDRLMRMQEPAWRPGDTHRRAKAHFGTRLAACDEAAPEARRDWLVAFFDAALEGVRASTLKGR